jgi:hypothetical protein
VVLGLSLTVTDTVSGVTALLHRLGFVDEKPRLVFGKTGSDNHWNAYGKLSIIVLMESPGL